MMEKFMLLLNGYKNKEHEVNQHSEMLKKIRVRSRLSVEVNPNDQKMSWLIIRL